jgi:protoporphyrin/coproporphyrin ferrochelatase
VVLVAHGTVSDLDDLREFVRVIRHGRPPSDALVDELRRRYEAIGGSPLLELTREQARALGRRLDAPVLVGMRLWRPSVTEVLRAAVELRLRRLVVVPLAPFSVHVYWEAARRSRAELEPELGVQLPELVPVPAWGREVEHVRAHAAQIAPLIAGAEPEHTALVMTAHSLPQKVIDAGDRYQEEVLACAALIAEELGYPYTFAFQSQGADGGDWLGPDLATTLESLARAGRRRVVLAPIGFLAEHVETLYDLDVEAAGWARGHGLEFVRVPALDSHPRLIEALARLVERALTNGASPATLPSG